MQVLGARLYSLFATIIFFAAAFLRLLMLLFDLSEIVFAYYLLIFAGVFFIWRKTFSCKEYENAFFGEKPEMCKMSKIASAGFFIEFVHICVNVYYMFENDGYKNTAYFLPVCIAGFAALLTCYYFYIFSLTYRDNNFDFRNLKLLHLSAIVWCACRLLSLMSQPVSFTTDIDGTIKNIVFVLAICFYCRFSFEIEDNNKTKPSTLFTASAFSYLGSAFFINRIMSSIFSSSVVNWDDNVTALSVVMMGAFAFYFQKSIDISVVKEEF